MPGGDGTGPMGQGPMTGRGAGYCAGNNMPGFAAPGWGRGFGRGRGRGYGRGFGRGYGFGRGFGWRSFWQQPVIPVYGSPAYPMQPSKEEQVKMLEAEKSEIEAELEALKKEIEELKKQ